MTRTLNSLDDLLSAIKAGDFDYAPGTTEEDIEQGLAVPANWEELPKFGGDWPADTHAVWSWDEDRVMVGTCKDDMEILDRDDETAWWN